MATQKNKAITAGINEALALLPTEQQIILAIRYDGGPESLINPITEARQRLEKLRDRLQEQKG